MKFFSLAYRSIITRVRHIDQKPVLESLQLWFNHAALALMGTRVVSTAACSRMAEQDFDSNEIGILISGQRHVNYQI